MLNVHLNHPSCRTVGCIREPAKKSVENSTLGSDPPRFKKKKKVEKTWSKKA